MMMDHFDEWWHDIYEISFAIMKYQLTSHQEWWNEIYEWWLVDKSWWTSASEEPSLEPAAETSENFEKPAAKDTRLKDGWKRCLPQISMAMSGYIHCIYHVYTPFSNNAIFLTKVDRNPFMPSFAIFWQANQNCFFNVVYENLPYGRTRPLGHRLGLAMRPFHDARRMRTMSAPFLSLT